MTHKGAQYHLYPDGRVVDNNDTLIEDVALVAILIGLAYDNDEHEPKTTTIHQTFSPNAVTEEPQVPRPQELDPDIPGDENNLGPNAGGGPGFGSDNSGGTGGDASFE